MHTTATIETLVHDHRRHLLADGERHRVLHQLPRRPARVRVGQLLIRAGLRLVAYHRVGHDGPPVSWAGSR